MIGIPRVVYSSTSQGSFVVSITYFVMVMGYGFCLLIVDCDFLLSHVIWFYWKPHSNGLLYDQVLKLKQLTVLTLAETSKEAATETHWLKAMDEEIRAIEKNGTWELTELPPGQKPIGVKWVYRTKYKSNGDIDRFKERLVAKGYKQKPG
nr:Retrovirus-related Pol polyprotein from transposon TNT 1-94 [Ipomoea batatas]